MLARRPILALALTLLAFVGALVAREDVIDLVARIAPPYPLPVPSTRAALSRSGSARSRLLETLRTT